VKKKGSKGQSLGLMFVLNRAHMSVYFVIIFFQHSDVSHFQRVCFLS